MPQKQVLSSLGRSLPVAVNPVSLAISPPPSILCLVSAGATLSYDIEVTGDAPDALGYFPASATWFPFDAAAVGLTASQNATLTSKVTFICVNLKTYISGSLTFEVVQ